MRPALIAALLCCLAASTRAEGPVDASTIRGKLFCGYQAWFRCPGDPDGGGWIHWSRRGDRIDPSTLTFEMWPDVSDLDADETYPAPGFAHTDGRPARLFSSANPKTVRRHFEWMRDYGIDGAFLQHFLVDLPGGPGAHLAASRGRVMGHVAEAAAATGRAWAISFDVAGMPREDIYDVLTAEWKRLVDAGIPDRPGYLHEGGRPVVQVWGFFRGDSNNRMTPELANRIIDFFHADGPTRAYLAGGGDWNWRKAPEDWRAFVLRFDAYSPWNVGNYAKDAEGTARASTGWWEADKAECEARGVFWLPVVYPGFGWDNLMSKPAGTTTIPRRGGAFFWEQFRRLGDLKASSAYVAMFDEVDEGTAIFKVSNDPPAPGRFLTYEGLPPDWYLRLAGEGARVIRGERPASESLPFRP